MIAEGIESEEQSQILRELNCEFGQGFWFSKPLPADQILPLLAKYSSSHSTNAE